MAEPCKTCLPGVPRHTRQRIITAKDGSRRQVCERCGKTLAILSRPGVKRQLETAGSAK